MLRRPLLLALPLIPALVLAAPLLHEAPTVSSSAPREDRPVANPGGVSLRNTGRVAVEVEVRSGGQGDCSEGRILATQMVQPGARWEIRSSQPVCFRRTDPVGPQRQARTWERKATPQGQLEEVIL